ncbi:MAG: exopolysaccharide biosynthesis protein [Pseudomonadota bacterium]
MTETRPEIRDMRTLLVSLKTCTAGETITVEDLLNAVGRRAFGPILAVLGFVAISPLTIVPGASWLVAFVTLLISLQIAVGFKRPWLPRKALDFSFPREALENGVDQMKGAAFMIDRLLSPRFGFLTEAPFVQLTALLAVAAAVITFPLGLVPFGPVLPGLCVLFIGLGLTARDGAMILLAGGSLVGAMVIVVRIIDRIV